MNAAQQVCIGVAVLIDTTACGQILIWDLSLWSQMCYHWTTVFCRPHAHPHTFNSPLSGTTWVCRFQKGKNQSEFTEARDSEWQWHQMDHMQTYTSLQTDSHTSTSPPAPHHNVIVEKFGYLDPQLHSHLVFIEETLDGWNLQ